MAQKYETIVYIDGIKQEKRKRGPAIYKKELDHYVRKADQERLAIIQDQNGIVTKHYFGPVHIKDCPRCQELEKIMRGRHLKRLSELGVRRLLIKEYDRRQEHSDDSE